MAVGRDARPVTDVAGELGCDWHTANRAVLSWGEALLGADCDRVGAVCQWPVGSAQWRTVELPGGGQQNCPLAARCSARGSVGQWRHPLSGGGLGEADAVAGCHDDVGVVQEPVDGGVGDGLGHQLVEPGGVQVA